MESGSMANQRTPRQRDSSSPAAQALSIFRLQVALETG